MLKATGALLAAAILVTLGARVGPLAAAAIGRATGSVPNVRLRTQNNQEVRFYDDLVKGKIVMINFMFTTCTTLCPRSTENLVRVQQVLGEHVGKDIFLISVSVDPDHDTPDVLKRYAEQHHVKAGWVFVTGTNKDIDAIRRRFRAYEGNDKAQHTGMLIYGDDARGAWAAMPVMVSPATIAQSVLRLVTLKRISESTGS